MMNAAPPAEALVPDMPEPRRELSVNLKTGTFCQRTPEGVLGVPERHFLIDVHSWTNVNLKVENGRRRLEFLPPNEPQDNGSFQLAITAAPCDQEGQLVRPDDPPLIWLAHQFGVAQQIGRLIRKLQKGDWPAPDLVALVQADLRSAQTEAKEAPQFYLRLRFIKNVPRPEVLDEFVSPREKIGHVEDSANSNS